MALVFGFPTPEAVLVVLTCELHALNAYGAAGTDRLCGRFPTFPSLRPFGRSREEQMRQAFTGSVRHPVVSLDQRS